MRCLVTGGTGLIGSHLVRLLLEKHCQVAVLVRPSSSAWRIADLLPSLTVIPGDLGAMARSAAAIRAFAPEVVFHLAWHGVLGGCHGDLRQITENLLGTLELLGLVHQSGCQRFVGVGSQAEYGPQDSILTEDAPTRPRTLYGVAKLCAGRVGEQLCEVWGCRFTWLRLLAAYGPTDEPEHLIPMVILSLLRGEKPKLTTGEQRWDYLYAEDAAQALWQVANSTATGTFLLASGQSATVRAIVEQLRDLIDRRLPIGWGERPGSAGCVRHLEGDSTRLQRCIGWAPRVRFAEGLRRTVEWFRANEWRYEKAAAASITGVR